jgi:ATP-binding cassette subfamily F protein uup
MLDRLATRVLALDGKGGGRYYADYQQWERLHKADAKADAVAAARQGESAQAVAVPSVGAVSSALASAATTAPKKRLGFKEQQELAGMEAAIERTESELRSAEAALNDPAVLNDHRKMAQASQRLADAQARLATLFARWEELEARA